MFASRLWLWFASNPSWQLVVFPSHDNNFDNGLPFSWHHVVFRDHCMGCMFCSQLAEFCDLGLLQGLWLWFIPQPRLVAYCVLCGHYKDFDNDLPPPCSCQLVMFSGCLKDCDYGLSPWLEAFRGIGTVARILTLGCPPGWHLLVFRGQCMDFDNGLPQVDSML
jgi:hypothetical protein